MLALYVNRSFFLQVKQRDNELQIGQNSLSKANILGTAEAVRRLCQCCPPREGAKYRLVPCVLNSFPYRELTKRRSEASFSLNPDVVNQSKKIFAPKQSQACRLTSLIGRKHFRAFPIVYDLVTFSENCSRIVLFSP